MQITNTARTVIHNNTRQGAKVVGVSNSNAQTSTGKGFSSTPAAMFRNSTKDDYDTSTLKPSQKRILSLQEQITNLNSDEKMEKDTKNNLLKPLQEELASLQEQILKQQEGASVTDNSQRIGSKDQATVTTENTDADKINSTENNDKVAVQQSLSSRKASTQEIALQVKSSSPIKSPSAKPIRSEKYSWDPDYDWYSSQDYKDLVAEDRKRGYTDEEIYYSTHVVTSPEWAMREHMHKITDIVKEVCDKNGFDYYERPGHMPDMEAILKKNGKNGKAAYEAMSQAFSDFEKTIWQQTAKDREGFSFTHDNGYEGGIWEMIIPPSPDPKKSRDPLGFIK